MKTLKLLIKTSFFNKIKPAIPASLPFARKTYAEPCFSTFPTSNDVAVDTSGFTCATADTEA